MKIAQVVCTFPPYKGGIGNSAFNFSKNLRNKNINIITYTPQYNKKIKKEEGVVRIKPWIKYGNGAFIPTLLCKLKKADAVILHYPFFGGSEIVWLWKIIFGKNKKLIIFNHHVNVAKLPFLIKFLSWPSIIISHSLFKKADIIACASLDYVKNSSLNKIYNRYQYKFKEIPFGVDIKKFKPLKEKKQKKINKYKLLFVGGLDKAHYFKGIDILLKALSKIKKIDWELNIVGEGDLMKKYKNLSSELNIKKQINFLGKLDDEKLVEIYQSSHLFILPSINKGEAFGLVLLEAMASGCPVIATNLPGVRKVFKNGKQGMLVEPKNIQDLKEKISIILKNEKLRKAMSKNARQWIVEKYSWDKLGNRLIKLL